MRASSSGLPRIIPKSEWSEVDYVSGYPTSLIVDQGQLGACVGFSCVGAWTRQHYIRTGQVVVPSGWWIYDQINGGQDNGAVINDAQTVMIQQGGAPPASAYPRCLFRAGQKPAGSYPWYTEDVPIKLASSAEAATAHMMGMLTQLPLNAGIFSSFDSNGVARGSIGNSSNHSIYLAGQVQINGTWYFRMVNSWGPTWGPFKNGTCLIPLAAIDNPAMEQDGWCHASTISQDDNPPGAP